MRLKVSNAVLASLAVHAGVVAALALVIQPAPRGGAGDCALCVFLAPQEFVVPIGGLLPEEPEEIAEPEPAEDELPLEPEVTSAPPEPPVVQEPPDPVFTSAPSLAIANTPPAIPAPLEMPAAKPAPKTRAAKPAARTIAKSSGGGTAGGQARGDTATTPPKLAFAPAPDYPDAIEARGIGGSVVVTFTVDTRGRVAGARVARSSGEASLDGAALAAVRRYRFSPAMAAGRPVEWAFEKRITFRPARG